MSDLPDGGIGAKELLSFVERIERLQEERDAITDDIKDVYGEAKARGYDKTVLGQVVSARRKRSKDASKFDGQGELFGLYWDAVERASHTHVREAA